jgi:hypothetical protein
VRKGIGRYRIGSAGASVVAPAAEKVPLNPFIFFFQISTPK